MLTRCHLHCQRCCPSLLCDTGSLTRRRLRCCLSPWSKLRGTAGDLTWLWDVEDACFRFLGECTCSKLEWVERGQSKFQSFTVADRKWRKHTFLLPSKWQAAPAWPLRNVLRFWLRITILPEPVSRFRRSLASAQTQCRSVLTRPWWTSFSCPVGRTQEFWLRSDDVAPPGRRPADCHSIRISGLSWASVFFFFFLCRYCSEPGSIVISSQSSSR